MESRLPDPKGILGGSPYVDPREVEHPLTPLRDLEVVRFAWIQPQLMHPAYELWGLERVVATLRFRDINRRTALAASTEGVYTISATAAEGEDFVVESAGCLAATFRRGPYQDGAIFIGEQRAYAWIRLSRWDRVHAFADKRGEAVMRFETSAEETCRTIVTISPAMRADPDATLLAIAGQYLVLAASPEGPWPSKRTVST